MSERYNHKIAESKWQKKWQEAGIFKVEKNKNKKILCVRDVSISFGKDSYGACKKLYTW